MNLPADALSVKYLRQHLADHSATALLLVSHQDDD